MGRAAPIDYHPDMANISDTPRSKSSSSHAAPDDEDQIFRDIIRNIGPLPEGIRRVEYSLGEDSYGDPAVWMIFIAADDLKPSKQKIDEYYRFTQEVLAAVHRSDSDRFPFVRIVTE